MKHTNLTMLLLAMVTCTVLSCKKEKQNLSDASTASEQTTSGTVAGKGKPGSSYPNYNTNPLPPDPTGMTKQRLFKLASQYQAWLESILEIPLEAIGGETAWGNPLTTQALIDKYEAKRIQCSSNSRFMESVC